jgi:NAD+ diphosphatase
MSQIVSKLNFCPNCGSNKIQKINKTLTLCQNCNYEIYANPKPSSTTIMVCGDSVLLGRRAKNPEKDKWGFGGGFLDAGEDAYFAGIREIKEELSIEVSSLEYIGSFGHDYNYKGDLCTVSTTAFVCFVDIETKKKIVPADDVAEVKWFTFEELVSASLAFPEASNLIRDRLFEYLGYFKNKDLQILRQVIDNVDRELLLSLKKRFEIVRSVGQYKKQNDLPVVDSSRWQEVMNSRLELAKVYDLNIDFVTQIWNLIHAQSCKNEEKILKSEF